MHKCILLSLFSFWGLRKNMFCNGPIWKNTKQNFPHIPGKYTRYTFLHGSGKVWSVPFRFRSNYVDFINILMNICRLFKFTKRSRKIFAMIKN